MEISVISWTEGNCYKKEKPVVTFILKQTIRFDILSFQKSNSTYPFLEKSYESTPTQIFPHFMHMGEFDHKNQATHCWHMSLFFPLHFHNTDWYQSTSFCTRDAVGSGYFREFSNRTWCDSGSNPIRRDQMRGCEWEIEREDDTDWN